MKIHQAYQSPFEIEAPESPPTPEPAKPSSTVFTDAMHSLTTHWGRFAGEGRTIDRADVIAMLHDQDAPTAARIAAAVLLEPGVFDALKMGSPLAVLDDVSAPAQLSAKHGATWNAKLHGFSPSLPLPPTIVALRKAISQLDGLSRPPAMPLQFEWEETFDPWELDGLDERPQDMPGYVRNASFIVNDWISSTIAAAANGRFYRMPGVTAEQADARLAEARALLVEVAEKLEARAPDEPLSDEVLWHTTLTAGSPVDFAALARFGVDSPQAYGRVLRPDIDKRVVATGLVEAAQRVGKDPDRSAKILAVAHRTFAPFLQRFDLGDFDATLKVLTRASKMPGVEVEHAVVAALNRYPSLENQRKVGALLTELCRARSAFDTGTRLQLPKPFLTGIERVALFDLAVSTKFVGLIRGMLAGSPELGVRLPESDKAFYAGYLPKPPPPEPKAWWRRAFG